MDEELAAHLAHNKFMWQMWSNFGVTEKTVLSVDFHFRSAKRSSANRLTETLKKMGFSVSTETTRRLLFLRVWEITATETACWTLGRLQDRTRELFHKAAWLSWQPLTFSPKGPLSFALPDPMAVVRSESPSFTIPVGVHSDPVPLKH